MKVAAALLVLCSWKAGALRFAAVEEAITTEG